MKTPLLLLTAVIVVLTGGRAHAVPDKTFTSSGQILPGEEWENIYIYNDDTIVDMLGGNVDGIATYDASTLNFFDGYVSTLTALQFSRANLSGGEIYALDVWDSASTYISGSASIFAPRVSDFGNLNMSGGTVDHLGAIESGTINLYGGSISDYLVALDSGIVNVYGRDLVKTSSGGAYGYGQVYGLWLDDTPFSINLNGPGTYSHITLIPEPTSLLLLALGGLLSRNHLYKSGNCSIIKSTLTTYETSEGGRL